MTTIRAVFRDGSFRPLEKLDLPENAEVRIALISSDDLAPAGICQVADNGEAFRFLDDPREDLYSESDGEPV